MPKVQLTEPEADNVVLGMYVTACGMLSLFAKAGDQEACAAAALIVLRLAPDEPTRARLYETDPRPFLEPENLKMMVDLANSIVIGPTAPTSH